MSTGLERDRWQRVGQVLDAALSCAPKRWPEVLDAMCVGAPDLRREVEELLERLDDARYYLATPPSAIAAAAVAEARPPTDVDLGRRIGAYSLVREIGRGGMSRVFLARRADGEFEQDVALKLLRPGLDTDVDRARFRAERQILASLNHPNIGRLLDGGITEVGQPYLVLEYVEGEPIDAHCDARRASVRRRIELFLLAAEATQYAHRNLIVHRDIKTSNILVSVDGVVKLLDFGLAKLVEPATFSGDASITHTGARWMTPEYAAPEQLRHEPVTTVTDVYQLGVVLYRLLAGRLPFTVGAGGLSELAAAVMRGDPAPPSVVARETDPARAKMLQGDLDAIVLKALRTEPSERFASVDALSDDLRRHLTGHPVLARRAGTAYRARRFVRRHRIETFAAVGISLSLIAGAALSLWQARRAAAERDLAALASRESNAVTSFVMGVFEASDPAQARGDTLTAEQLVQRAAARADMLRGQPAAQARMLEVTGRLYRSLGRYAEARAVVQRALSIRESSGERGTLTAATTLGQLSDLHLILGAYDAADSTAREALKIQERSLGLANAPVAASLTRMAGLAVYRGELAAAEAFSRRALAARQTALGPSDSATADSHLALGAILEREGRFVDAEREFRQALAIVESNPRPNDDIVAGATLKVAYLLDEDRERYAEAAPLYQRALEIRRRVYGEGSPMVAATLFDIAEFLSRRGDRLGAVAPARQAWGIARRAYGSQHPAVADFAGSLADILYKAGRLDEADSLYRQAIAIDQRTRGPDHVAIAGIEMGLARVRIDRGDYTGAEALVRDAVRIREHASGPESPNTVSAEGLLGMVLSREHRYSTADSLLRYSIATMERQVGREHHDVRELYAWLADLEDARGQHAEATRDRAIASVH
ncbi:MAG TPA: serine/threonine-protein kinase [Gemmatimonadaceae bacterium]|jgi:serine/threonine-protein kinase|nr:serine/threonine-protein kinase [Gemmatimonadaceae bacterium]